MIFFSRGTTYAIVPNRQHINHRRCCCVARQNKDVALSDYTKEYEQLYVVREASLGDRAIYGVNLDWLAGAITYPARTIFTVSQT